MEKTKKVSTLELLSEITDSSTIPCFVLDAKHRIVHWNLAIEVLSGIKKSEIMGTDEQWRAFYVLRRPTLADLILEEAEEEKIAQYYGSRYRKSNLVTGAYEAEDFFPAFGENGIWLHFTASPVRSNSGKIIGAVETLQDITERKKAEEMLTKIIDASNIPSFVIDKEHKITHWNTAIEVLTSLAKKEMVGTDEQWRMFYSQRRPSLADLIVDGASAGQIEAYYHGKCRQSSLIEGAYEAEDFFPAVGDGGRWLHFTAGLIRDNSGGILGVVETLQDVTERKNAEKALLDSEKSFRDLFESALDAIWVQDIDGNIRIANEAAARLFGDNIEQLCRDNISSFWSPEGIDNANLIQTKLVKNLPVDMPYRQRLYRKDGTELIIELTTRMIEQKNKTVTFQNIARDVTREIKMQQSIRFYLRKVLVAEEEERKRIARELHDETAQLLLLLIHNQDTLMSNRKIKMSQNAREELAKLNELAKEILTGIRLYSQELRPAILDDLGLMAALEWLGDKLAKEKGIDVSVQLDMQETELPVEVQLVLFRIVQEAITNIRKHAKASMVTIKLESEPDKKRLIISDNGIGIAVPLKWADLSSRGKFGLIGMRERAELINGKMRFTSELGKGTLITVEFQIEK
jgi:PAS domain S-box-containing protein